MCSHTADFLGAVLGPTLGAPLLERFVDTAAADGGSSSLRFVDAAAAVGGSSSLNSTRSENSCDGGIDQKLDMINDHKSIFFE